MGARYTVRENEDGLFELRGGGELIGEELDDEDLARELTDMISQGECEADEIIRYVDADGEAHGRKARRFLTSDMLYELGEAIAQRPVVGSRSYYED